jgi:hypothetical protein
MADLNMSQIIYPEQQMLDTQYHTLLVSAIQTADDLSPELLDMIPDSDLDSLSDLDSDEYGSDTFNSDSKSNCESQFDEELEDVDNTMEELEDRGNLINAEPQAL